jgi:hypothetical protein
MGRLLSWGKKIFSLALTFNALLTIYSSAGILVGYYEFYQEWKPFSPYLIDGFLFWMAILASILNIFPAVVVGKVKTGRLWFHHYVWGAAVLILAALSMMVYSLMNHVSLMTPYTKITTDTTINVYRFFALGGFTLVLDDFADISSHLRSFLGGMKQKASNGHQMIHALQVVLGLITLYVFSSVTVWIAQSSQNLTAGNLMLAGSLFVTALTCFASAGRRMWHQKPKMQIQPVPA